MSATKTGSRARSPSTTKQGRPKGVSKSRREREIARLAREQTFDAKQDRFGVRTIADAIQSAVDRDLAKTG